jgi:hypothetical protein
MGDIRSPVPPSSALLWWKQVDWDLLDESRPNRMVLDTPSSRMGPRTFQPAETLSFDVVGNCLMGVLVDTDGNYDDTYLEHYGKAAGLLILPVRMGPNCRIPFPDMRILALFIIRYCIKLHDHDLCNR